MMRNNCQANNETHKLMHIDGYGWRYFTSDDLKVQFQMKMEQLDDYIGEFYRACLNAPKPIATVPDKTELIYQ
jgi:hypothetical protein